MAKKVKMGRAYVTVGAENAPLYKALNKAEKRIARFGAKVAKGAQAFAGIGTAIVTPFVIATQKGLEFEKQMVEVAAVTGSTDIEFKKLEDTARRLGETTSFTATEAADGMTQLGRAGFSTNEIIKAIPTTLALARASGLGMGQVAEIMADVSRSFQIGAKDIGRVADVITFTANNSTTNIEQLGGAMRNVAPAAAAVGQSLENVSAALGVLANRGIKGEMAGTQLQAVLLRLADTKVQDTLEDLGVSLRDADGNMRKFTDVLADLDSKLNIGDKISKLSILNELFGRRGVKAAINLGSLSEEVEKFEASTKSAGGTTQTTADIMEGKLNKALNLALSAFESLQIAISKQVQPVMEKWLGTLKNVINDVTRFVDENAALVKGALQLGSAALIAAAGLGAMAIAAKGVSLAIGLTSGLAGAVGFAVTAFKALNVELTIASVTTIATPIKAATAAMKGLSLATIAAKASALKFKAALLVGMAGPLAAVGALVGSLIFLYQRLFNYISDTEAIRQAENAVLNLRGQIKNLNYEIAKLNEQQGLGFNYTAESATRDVEARIIALKGAGKTADEINSAFAKDIEYLKKVNRAYWTESAALTKENFEAERAERAKTIEALQKALDEDKARTLKTEKQKADEILKIRVDIFDKIKKLDEQFQKDQVSRAARIQGAETDRAFRSRLEDDPQAEEARLLKQITEAELDLLVAKLNAEEAIAKTLETPTKDAERLATSAVEAYKKQASALDDLNMKRREALSAVSELLREEERALEERLNATVAFSAQVKASFDKNEFVKDAKSQFDGLNKEAQRFILGAEKQAEQLRNQLISGAISQGAFDEQLAELQGRLGDALAARSDKRKKKTGNIETGTFGTFSAREAAGRLGKNAIKIAENQLEQLKGLRRDLQRQKLVATY